MLELTCLGHATLLVRSAGTTILCDPILGDAVSGGGNVVHPRRTIHVERLPALDAVLISHHHSDHFSLPELGRIPAIQKQRILAPAGSEVIDELRRFGCKRVEPLNVGQPVSIGDIIITPTPSAVDFPEVGFLFRSGGTSALNLVDTQFHGVLGQLLAILDEPVQLALVPFQAGGYMSLLPLRVGGPPDGLIEAIARWSEEYTQEIVADLSLIRPGYVVPFADGLLYRDEGINAWHFPLSDEYFLDLMGCRGVHGCPYAPGTAFIVSSSGVDTRAGASEFVAAELKQESRRVFDPRVQLNNVPMCCVDWNPGLPSEDAQTWVDRCAAIVNRVDANLCGQRGETPLMLEFDRLLDWFLEFCDAPMGMDYLYVARGNDGFKARLVNERPLSRDYGIRLHARDLLHLLEGRIVLEHITLGGAFRYHSPHAVDDLERIRGRVLGPLHMILGMK